MGVKIHIKAPSNVCPSTKISEKSNAVLNYEQIKKFNILLTITLYIVKKQAVNHILNYNSAYCHLLSKNITTSISKSELQRYMWLNWNRLHTVLRGFIFIVENPNILVKINSKPDYNTTNKIAKPYSNPTLFIPKLTWTRCEKNPYFNKIMEK